MMSVNGPVKITEISISNFRSFAPDSIPITGLSGINIFVGPNGVGKTVLFNAIRDCIKWDSFNSQGTYDIKKNYHDPEKPIKIVIKVDAPAGRPSKATFVQEVNSTKPTREPDPDIEPFFKQKIFPIGHPRQFSTFANPDAPVQHEQISANWSKIRQDAHNFLDTALPEHCPPKRNDDRPFFDIEDNRASLIEGSDGKANFLFMIFSIRGWRPGSVVLIEEPEIGMHPGLQKQFLRYLKRLVYENDYQFLLNTHSPYLMNLAVTEPSNEVVLFRLSKDASGCTQIDPVEGRAEHWSILTDLGHSPADVLHVNGVIWVEGPSDLIYVTTWVEKLAPELHRGKDYEVMWYGGSNFTHLGVEEAQEVRERLWQDTGAQEKLVSLLGLNPNGAFLVDSDSDKAGDKNATTRKRFKTINKAKDDFIIKCKQRGMHTWKVDPYIEKCILGHDKPLKGIKKVDWAHKYQREIETINSSDSSCRLKSHAEKEVRKLIDEIKKWR